jgi:hypothetical protein
MPLDNERKFKYLAELASEWPKKQGARRPL